MSDPDAEAADQWYEEKSRLMEEKLGKIHDVVMHALICYAAGGSLDLYYYPNGIPGTAIATMELSEARGEGSSNRVYECYELVMFTRQSINLDVAKDETTPFGRMHRMMNSVLNRLGRYSAKATLNPNETCEFPEGMPIVGGRYFIFDGYTSYPDDGPAEFGLMAVIEVFRSEWEFARKNGGGKLIQRLKDMEHYPYSDLDREPVA